jgi:putative oxidoreductase
MERDVVPSSRDLGVLLVRLGVGATLAAHGGQKVFGWFDGPGLEATAAGFDAMGFRPGKANALAAGVSEIGSGALLAAGLATSAAGAAAAGTMIVASAVHGPNGFFAQKGGYEYSAILGVTAAGIALAGPGRLSLDHATGDVLNRPWMKLVALAAIVPTSVFVVSQRNKALAAPSDAAPKPVTAPDTDRGRTP